jgi:hypothetical protein
VRVLGGIFDCDFVAVLSAVSDWVRSDDRENVIVFVGRGRTVSEGVFDMVMSAVPVGVGFGVSVGGFVIVGVMVIVRSLVMVRVRDGRLCVSDFDIDASLENDLVKDRVADNVTSLVSACVGFEYDRVIVATDLVMLRLETDTEFVFCEDRE